MGKEGGSELWEKNGGPEDSILPAERLKPLEMVWEWCVGAEIYVSSEKKAVEPVDCALSPNSFVKHSIF